MSIFHRIGEPRGRLSNFKICLATCCYGNITSGYTASMIEAGMALQKEGIEFNIIVFDGNCHVDDSRNKLVRDFLESDCTDLVFIDSDIQFSPSELLRLLKHDKDVVGGVYQLKEPQERYTVDPIPGRKIENGLLEVFGVGTGFLKIKRHVLEALEKKAICHIDQREVMETTRKTPIIFERIVADNKRLGGDYAFCWKWRQEGGRIYADPFLKLYHIGANVWGGMYGAYLKRREPLGLSVEIERIKQGTETNRDIFMLSEIYGNDGFAATAEMVLMCIMLARQANGTILECGTGLTTLAMAAANPNNKIISLDHDPMMGAHTQSLLNGYGLDNAKVIHAPLKEYGDKMWYDWSPNGDHFSLVVVDGPPGRRHDIFPIIGNSVCRNAPIIFDDYGTHIRDEARSWGGKVMVFGEIRKFAVTTKEV